MAVTNTTPPATPLRSPTPINEEQQSLSLELYILLCSLRLMQMGIHHRHGPEVNFAMTEVAFRPRADWEMARTLSWGDAFWEEAASHLQCLSVFRRDPRNSGGITGVDLSIALDDVVANLGEVRRDGASREEEVRRDNASRFMPRRFSGQQLLLILSFQFNVTVMAPHFSKNWNEWTSDDLIELAFYLQLSEVCSEFEGTVTSRSVKAWLEDLGRVFGLEWQSTIEEDSGGSDYQSSIGFGQDIGDSDYQSSIGFGQDIGDSDLQSLTDEQHSGISSSGSSTSEESLEEIEDLRWLSAFVDPTSLFG